MARALQWIRSLAFVVQMYAAMVLIALVYLPFAALDREWAIAACRNWCRWVRWTAGWMAGLETEIRGTPPAGDVLIAAKHQSFFDIILIASVVPRPRFIMKKELRWAPVLGWFALRIGCIPVDRSSRSRSMAKLVAEAQKGRSAAGQLIIYPQGTRVAPGAAAPYKSGSGVLYEELGQPCVPVAVNVGLFWPRRGILRKPGRAVIEFLPRIPPGLPRAEVMGRLEREIESASNRLMAEAGFPALEDG